MGILRKSNVPETRFMSEKINGKEKKNLSKTVKFRCTAENLLLIERNAQKNNLSVSELARRSVLKDKIVVNKPPKVNWQAYRSMSKVAKELNQIGNNINQIAKVFNSERLEGGSVPPDYPLPEELMALRYYLNQVNGELTAIKNIIIGKTK